MVSQRYLQSSGFQFYAVGKSDCGAVFVKRSFKPISLTWERCARCEEGFPFLRAMFEDYLDAMENGAILVSQI